FAKANVQKEIHDSHWEQFAQNLRHSYSSALSAGATTVRALPGATELLSLLWEKTELNQGVVTGNFEVTAQIKLEAAGLHSYLSRGAYASDSPLRLDFRRLAKNRWGKSRGRVTG